MVCIGLLLDIFVLGYCSIGVCWVLVRYYISLPDGQTYKRVCVGLLFDIIFSYQTMQASAMFHVALKFPVIGLCIIA